jgi:hypothetical protein
MTIVEELTAAARGVAALVFYNRRAAEYFDLSLRGLAGSFIAFLSVTALQAAMPALLGAHGPEASVFRAVTTVAILFSLQVGFSAIVLRQLKRLDGFVPYLVADNWATFFVTLGSTLLLMLGMGGDVALILIGILVIVIEINIARVIVTLTPLQIAMFLVAQLVGVTIGLLLVQAIFPATPAELEALGLNTQPA